MCIVRITLCAFAIITCSHVQNLDPTRMTDRPQTAAVVSFGCWPLRRVSVDYWLTRLRHRYCIVSLGGDEVWRTIRCIDVSAWGPSDVDGMAQWVPCITSFSINLILTKPLCHCSHICVPWIMAVIVYLKIFFLQTKQLRTFSLFSQSR